MKESVFTTSDGEYDGITMVGTHAMVSFKLLAPSQTYCIYVFVCKHVLE